MFLVAVWSSFFEFLSSKTAYTIGSIPSTTSARRAVTELSYSAEVSKLSTLIVSMTAMLFLRELSSVKRRIEFQKTLPFNFCPIEWHLVPSLQHRYTITTSMATISSVPPNISVILKP